MSSVPQVITRLAKCGHEYQATRSNGRARAFGDCDCPRGCGADDCTARLAYRGLCRSHYNRWVVYGDLIVTQPRAECKHCGGMVPAKKSSGPPPDYCSVDCRGRAGYLRNRGSIIEASRARVKAAKANRAATVKTCPQCERAFTPEATLAQKFCSKYCTAKWFRDLSDKICAEPDCDRPVRARGMCSMHWKRWARSEGMIENPEWDDRRRSNHQKRRALKLKLPADDIRVSEVFDRDGWVCSICSDPVEQDVAWPSPMSPSLDHIIPLSKGGHHVLENVALAHLTCNVRKGDQVEIAA